jgi:hypothetical protein
MDTLVSDTLAIVVGYLRDIRPLLLASRSMFDRLIDVTSRMTHVSVCGFYNPVYYRNVTSLTLDPRQLGPAAHLRRIAQLNPKLNLLTCDTRFLEVGAFNSVQMLAALMPNLEIDCADIYCNDILHECCDFDWSQFRHICIANTQRLSPKWRTQRTQRATRATIIDRYVIDPRIPYPSVTELRIEWAEKLELIQQQFPNVVSLHTTYWTVANSFSNLTSLKFSDSSIRKHKKAKTLSRMTSLRHLEWPLHSSTIPSNLTALTYLGNLIVDDNCSKLHKLPLNYIAVDTVLNDADDYMLPRSVTKFKVSLFEYLPTTITHLKHVTHLSIHYAEPDDNNEYRVTKLFNALPHLELIDIETVVYTRPTTFHSKQ